CRRAEGALQASGRTMFRQVGRESLASVIGASCTSRQRKLTDLACYIPLVGIMELAYAAATETGQVRLHNEDSYVAEKNLGRFVVVDGMGGHVGGEVASRTVADGVLEFIRATAHDPEKTWPFGLDPELSQPANRLQVAIRSANRKLA